MLAKVHSLLSVGLWPLNHFSTIFVVTALKTAGGMLARPML